MSQTTNQNKYPIRYSQDPVNHPHIGSNFVVTSVATSLLLWKELPSFGRLNPPNIQKDLENSSWSDYDWSTFIPSGNLNGDLPFKIVIFHSYVNVYQRVVFFPCQKRLKSNFPTSPLPSLHLPPVWVWTATPVAPEAEPPGAPHPPAVRTRRPRHATAPWQKHGALNFPKLKSWGEDVMF